MIEGKVRDDQIINERNVYPRLMRMKETPCVIVHFEKGRCGYQLTGDPGVERFWSSWTMEDFEDFEGILELRNER